MIEIKTKNNHYKLCTKNSILLYVHNMYFYLFFLSICDKNILNIICKLVKIQYLFMYLLNALLDPYRFIVICIFKF